MPTGFLIPANPLDRPHRVEIEHDGRSHLASLYKHIDCRTVTVITPIRGGALFGMKVDAWGDDEGLWVGDPIENHKVGYLFGQRVVGNWVLAGNDDEGNLIDLPAHLLNKFDAIYPVAATAS